MESVGQSSVWRSFKSTPWWVPFPWQAWIRNILGLLTRADCLVALKVLIICLMQSGSPSIPRTADFSPWLRMQQMNASPCLGSTWRSTNLLPDHSLTSNSWSWERSLREAKQFNARSIFSLVWSLHISTLNPSQVNTSAKLSASTLKKNWLLTSWTRCINLYTFPHTSIFVCSTSLLHIQEILIVYDHT